MNVYSKMTRGLALLGVAALLPACFRDGGSGGIGNAPVARDVRVDQPSPGSVGGVGDPVSACDGSNLYVAWVDHRNGINSGGSGGIYFNRSGDGGATWLPSDVRLDRAEGSAGFGHLPRIHLDGLRITVVWQDARHGFNDIYLNRSVDGGVTWEAEDVRLDTDTPGAAESQNPRIAGAGANLYVVWEDARVGEGDIFISTSSDFGATWSSSDVRLDTDAAGAGLSSNPELACAGTDVYVVWMDLRAGAWNVRLNRSADSGATWLAADLRIDHVALGTQAATAPLVSCDGTTVNVAWTDDRNGKYDIHLNRSADRGVTWLAADLRLDTNAAGAADSYLADLVSHGANVYAVWMDQRNGQLDVYLNRSGDGGATWLASDLRLDTDVPGAGGSLDPRISCSGSNVLVAWWDSRGGDTDVYVNRSTNLGAAWLASDVRVDHGGSAYVVPLDACLSGTNAYAVWVDSRQSPTFVETVVYSQRSSDAGATWAAQDVRASHVLPGGVNGSSNLPVVHAEGSSVRVAWIERRLGHAAVFFNRSDDMGATWRTSDLRLSSNNLAEVAGVQIAGSGSKIYVVWADARNGLQDIFFASSADGGATFSADRRLDTDVAGSASSGGPSIACEGDQVVVVWGDARSGNADIRGNRSLDGGRTWLAADVRIDRAPLMTQAYDPQVCMGGGAVHVVWQDLRNGPNYDVYVNRSTTAGATWGASDTRLDSDAPGAAFSLDPRIACAGAQVYVAWEDLRSGGSEIRVNRSSNAGASWLASDVRVDTASVNPTNRHRVRIASEGTSVYLAWQDARSGTYRIRFTRSIDGGATWLPSDVRLDSSASAEGAFEPEIACKGGDVVVVWLDRRDAHPTLDGDMDVYFNRSLDGGATWMPADLRLDAGDAAHKGAAWLRVSADGLRPVAVWEDYRAGTADIRLGALEK